MKIENEKQCVSCKKKFPIYEDDIIFYGKMKVPIPQSCPDCRSQRRWGFRNQDTLYKRKCDFSGEPMISLYSEDKPYKVYKEDIWWSDKWDPMDYGRDYDFEKPFFEQFNELLLSVPRRGMHQDGTNENSEYVTFGVGNKNCYMMFASFYCEDILFGTWCGMSKDCVDCRSCFNCEIMYESYSCEKCYNCIHCYTCENCQDCLFMDDCRNCKRCIGCKNLRNKEFYIYNKKATKEEYEEVKEKLLERDLAEEEKKFNKWKLQFPSVNLEMQNCENCTGEYINNAKNCKVCYNMVMGAEDCKYCQIAGWQGKDMWDCTTTGKECELMYEMHATLTSQNCAFCSFCRFCSDTYYCDCISNLKNCFGCSGISHKKYCILNKQYTKEEYEELLPKIIAHMTETKEWGEFFPLEISPFAYNETQAQYYFQLKKEEALEKGFKWIDDQIVDKTTANNSCRCIDCSKPYKITSQEEKFHKKIGVNSPTQCFECRRKRRAKLVKLQTLYDRKCDKCNADIQTSFAPERPEIVYCKPCYQDALIN